MNTQRSGQLEDGPFSSQATGRAQTPAAGLPSRRPPPWRRLLPGDLSFCAITAVLITSMLISGPVPPKERGCLVTNLALSLGGVAAILLAPRHYAHARLPYVILLRARLVLLMPHSVDMLRILTHGSAAARANALPAPSSALQGAAAGAAGVAAEPGGLHRLMLLVRGGLLLFVAVCWIQGCIATSTGPQLPPLVHLPLLGASVVGLCKQLPSACRGFVSENRQNRQVVRAVYWVLHQATALLCLASREQLAANAAAMEDPDKCVATGWALEFAIGFVLPTLMTWRTQLHAERQEVEGRPGGRMQLRDSQYERLCAPVLDACDQYGGVALPTALAALLAFVAAVVMRQGAHQQPAAQ